METEVKLSFKNTDSLMKVALSDLFSECGISSDPKTVTLENYYLDTPDMKILQRNGSVRKRIVKGDDSYIEGTVKYGGGSSSGIHKRYEWNARLNGDFSIEEFKKGISADGSFVRTVYKLDYFGTVIEACFDRGIIYNSDKSGSDEICELELEFISGNVNELMVLSERIKGEFDCLPLDKSKFQRTLELAKRG